MEAAVVAKTSAGCSLSDASRVFTRCTSRLKFFGNIGRIGRSVIRAANVASVPGRPSRLKNEPGIFPIAYIRSSKSTVRGKKSVPGRASPSQSVVSITVSPYRIVTDASVLGASRPIPSSKTVPPISLEKTWVWPPVFVANCEVLVINFPFDYIFLLILLSLSIG